MTGQERLRFIRAKIARAKKHVSELEREAHAFLRSRPYEVSGEQDPQTGEVVYRAVKVDDVPPSIAAISADALQNLKGALDHLACDLVEISGHHVERNTGFPIFASLGIYKAQASEKMRGMPRDVVEAIEAIKPYKGGNQVLWRLHSLNNVNKHRLLNIVGLASRFQSVTPSVLAYLRREWSHRYGAWPAPEAAPDDLIEYDRWHLPLKKGDVLFTLLPGVAAESTVSFTFDIAFCDAKVAERSPLLAQVGEMTEAVEGIITSFEPYFV
jgi:hypothetical protein